MGIIAAAVLVIGAIVYGGTMLAGATGAAALAKFSTFASKAAKAAARFIKKL